MIRRDFLKVAGMSAAALAMEGTHSTVLNAAQAKRVAGANGKVDVALIGIGNRGEQVHDAMAKTGLMNVVALCDVDMGNTHTQKVMNLYPKAKKYKDFRKLFDEMAPKLDAVIVCTPDFSHFPIAMRAIKEGVSVYVEKPMAHTFHEAELLMQAAKKHPEVVTQMGNQGHSDANYFQFKTWVEAGIIKDVTEITCHMNNDRRWHKWDPNCTRFPFGETAPQTMEWDTWLMTALYHDYSDKFHYGNWRCWYDFGMGALGDWGAHLFDTSHQFLELGLPYEVGMQRCDGHNDYFFPMESTIRFRFPRRGNMPACDLTWYDGQNNIPAVPAGYGTSEFNPDIPPASDGSVVPRALNPGRIIYSKDVIFKGGSHGSTLSLIPSDAAKELESRLPEVPKSPSNHYANFLLSVMGKEKTRSPFEVSGVLTQVMALGVIAQRLNTTFKFDRNTKEVLDNPFANALLYGVPPRQGWEEYYKI